MNRIRFLRDRVLETVSNIAENALMHVKPEQIARVTVTLHQVDGRKWKGLYIFQDVPQDHVTTCSK